MDLIWIEDFLALAATGSFSRAAEQRHVTQPAFSRRIRMLEEWAGAALFDRSAQPARLTEAGTRFHALVEELPRRLATAREAARTAERDAAVTLRFAATHALSLTFFPAWLRTLEPRLRLGPIQLASDTFAACEALMLAGAAQFLLCHHHAAVPTPLTGAGFRSVCVGEDELVPVSAPAAGGAARFALPGGGRLPLLAYSAESGLGRIFRALAAAAAPSARLEPTLTSHLAVVLRSMALDGRGLAWLPSSLVRDDLAASRLVTAGDAAWRFPVEVRLFRREPPEAAAAEAFWRLVADDAPTSPTAPAR